MKYTYLETMKQAAAEQMKILTAGLTGWDLRDALSESAKKVADSIVNGLTDEEVAQSFAKLTQEHEEHRWEHVEKYPCPFDGYTLNNKNGHRNYTIERKDRVVKERGRIVDIIDESTTLSYDFTNGSPIAVYTRTAYKWSEDANALTAAMKKALWKQAFKLCFKKINEE